jgi:hypothetical protein
MQLAQQSIVDMMSVADDNPLNSGWSPLLLHMVKVCLGRGELNGRKRSEAAKCDYLRSEWSAIPFVYVIKGRAVESTCTFGRVLQTAAEKSIWAPEELWALEIANGGKS